MIREALHAVSCQRAYESLGKTLECVSCSLGISNQEPLQSTRLGLRYERLSIGPTLADAILRQQHATKSGTRCAKWTTLDEPVLLTPKMDYYFMPCEYR